MYDTPELDRTVRWRIHEWVEYGLEDDSLDAVVARVDEALWVAGRAGVVDESMASFDDNERWIADQLAAEGHSVVALPVSRRQGVRTADASVGGFLTEFKTYHGTDPCKLSTKTRIAGRQASRVVIYVAGDLDPTEVREAFRRRTAVAVGTWLRGLKFIGAGLHLEWGEWNRLLPSGYIAAGTTVDMQRTVETVMGPVIPTVGDGVVVARGIPYARAGRFELPVDVEPWVEPRDASRRGPSAPQSPPDEPSVAGSVGATLDQSEACQVLTVTAPADASDLPVLVWIHGGAYVSGAGEAPEYDADDLARAGVVVVSVTYRLGVLGYLAPTGSAHRNLGLYDQIAALRWVQSNVPAFGGDPDCVTIAGHSAGGDAVVSLLMCELADGLYHRAVLQSAPLGLSAGRESLTVALRASLAELVDDPLTASVDEILTAQRELIVRAAAFGVAAGMPFAPEPGHAPLPAADIVDDRLAQVARRVDLLIGHTAADAASFVLRDPRAVGILRFGRLGRALLDPAIRRYTATIFGRPARDLANRWRRSGGRAADYVFTWTPAASVYGACHSIELPFLFSGDWSDAPMLGGENPDPEVAAEIRQVWVDFARDGCVGLSSQSLRF